MGTNAGKKPRVLMLGKFIYEKERTAQLPNHFELIYNNANNREEFIAALKAKSFGQFEAIVKPHVEFGVEPGFWNDELIDLLPPTVLLFTAGGAGYDQVDAEAFGRKGIWYCNGRGAGDDATSDLALFLILSVFRLTWVAEEGARACDPARFWEAHDEVGKYSINPKGRILGCVGLGSIGKMTAKKARALGLSIHYYDPFRAPPEVEEELNATYYNSLTDLFACKPDCVNVSVLYSAKTKHLIGAPEFAMMPRGCRIVNTSRGQVIDEQALVEALKTGQIFSAGLDVHYHEPHVNPALAANPHVTLTAHIGGVARDTHLGFENTCMDNLELVFFGSGQPRTPVNDALVQEAKKNKS